jgi:septal ring factor EnvC (AmiA/AmiB activator)
MTDTSPEMKLFLQQQEQTNETLNRLDGKVDKVEDALSQMAIAVTEMTTTSSYMNKEISRIEDKVDQNTDMLIDHEKTLQRNGQKWAILAAAATIVIGFSLSVVKPILENRVTNDKATALMAEILEEVKGD